MLEIRARSRAGSFVLDADLDAPPGVVTVLVGESGAGKSTLLRLAAGLRAPESGRVSLHGRVLADAEAGTWVPPERRQVGYVSQDYALFPHLSVRDNVAFGPESAGLSRAEVRERTARSLDRFALGPVANRRPGALSGGQQQRVALARALVLDPALVLLDEPLSALDPRTRREVRGELRALLAELSCVTLFVTHSPAEALAFGDRIAVLEGGRITQRGTPADLARHPGSAYVAEFLGVNLLPGVVVDRPGDGSALVRAGDALLRVPDPGFAGPVRLRIHPHDVTLSLEPPAGSARNVLRGPVEEVLPEPPGGDLLRVLVGSRPRIAAQVTRAGAEALGLRPGIEVHASFKATATGVYPG